MGFGTIRSGCRIETTTTRTKGRRTFGADFKARVAPEAVRGAKTVHETAAEHEAYPVQSSKWNKERPEGVIRVFETGSCSRGTE